jgi:hypothetical protein
VVFGEPRTGSNLFFDILDRLQDGSSDILDIRNMLEPYTHDETEQVRLLRRCVNALHEGCNLPVQIDGGDDIWDHSTTQGFFARLKEESGSAWLLSYQKLMDAFNSRYKRQADWINYISSIPSASEHSILVFKVFREHLDELSLSPIQFIKSLRHVNCLPIVLWRRSIIETFVSYKIAVKKNSWLLENTTEKDTIHVERLELELFLDEKRQYYESIRDGLAANGIDVDVFEYGHDLSNRDAQLKTVTRLQERLGVGGNNLAERIIAETVLKKQAQVPLNQQIENWDEVLTWGYGKCDHDWDDIFAQS